MGWHSQGHPTTPPGARVGPAGRPAPRRRRPAGGRGGRTRRRRRPPTPAGCAGSTPEATRSRARAAEPSRSKPHGAQTTTSGSPARAASQVTRSDFSPARPTVATPPAGARPSPGPSDRGRRAGRSTPAAAPGGRGPAGSPRAARRPRAVAAASRPARRRPRGGRWRRPAPGSSPAPPRPCAVEGEHLRRAAEVGQGVVDQRDVDRAHRAQVLGDHEVGVEVGEGAGVEVVEVVAGLHRARDERVDLRRREALGQGAGRHDPPLPGLGRDRRTRRSPRRRRPRPRSRRGSR